MVEIMNPSPRPDGRRAMGCIPLRASEVGRRRERSLPAAQACAPADGFLEIVDRSQDAGRFDPLTSLFRFKYRCIHSSVRFRDAVMPSWSNGKLTVYHGTDTLTLGAHGPFKVGGSLAGFVADLNYCRALTDFGKGFYTTTKLHQAREWANARTRRLRRSKRLRASPVQPWGLVLQFDLDRSWLASQESLVFVREVSDFWDFVTHCRAGFAVHARAHPNVAYDVVYGLVTIWRQKLLIQDCDQISFHTPTAVGYLNRPSVAEVAGNADGLFS